ncbi:DUF2167 domain-containing protein [Sphingomonas sp. RT2P30]|uniref:DUF2167 domain-containing protein n=1 Tax=Parasphingomonas halimpatiens TaxID=3096162 RepID=UPI002FC6220B
MKSRMVAGALVLAMATVAAPAGAQNSIDAASQRALRDFVQNLHKQTGDVAIPQAHAVIHLGTRYYFIGPADAKRVITDIWRNPANASYGVLGLILPADKTVVDNSWGAVVTYQDTGYVADTDASSQDYDKVLAGMREGEAEDNELRRRDGYPELRLVGWAQPPLYDRSSHSLIWARDLKSSDTSVDGLNYDVRSLGRHGVLSLNMVWDMPHLAEVRNAAADLGKAAGFEKGSAYADYDKSVDKTAEYGLAGLVAAGVGAVAVKKLGILAIMLGFGKKLFILIAIGAAAAWKRIKGLFVREHDNLEG